MYIEFDKSDWPTSINGNYGFNHIHISGVELSPTSVIIRYRITPRNYMLHLGDAERALIYRWEHDKSEHLYDDNFLLTVVNLVYMSFAPIASFTRQLSFELPDFIQQAVDSHPERFEQIRALFYSLVEVERDNTRHIMGLMPGGYITPTQSVLGGLGQLIGNVHAEHPREKLPKLDTSHFNWSDKPIDENSKVLVNMSFGKESLMTTYALRDTVGLKPENIGFTIFGHEKTGFQETYMELVKEAPYNEHPLQKITTNYLDQILVPACDVKIGGPINMLTHIYEMLNQLAYRGEGYTHLLCGDEYDRCLPEWIKFSPKSEHERLVYSYDYEQSPVYAYNLNQFQAMYPGGIVRGSLIYGITGYQAQMMLDRHYNLQGLQLSCHTAHEHGGKNCGVCQKCTRIGVIKSIMGNTATINYEPSQEQKQSLMAWSKEEFFISYMRVNSSFLDKQYLAMRKLVEDDLWGNHDVAPAPSAEPGITHIMAREYLGANAYSTETSLHSSEHPERPILLAPHLHAKFVQALTDTANSL